MDYDRVRVKRMAREALRRARPRPWVVTLVYTLLSTLPGILVSFATSLPDVLINGLIYTGGREIAQVAGGFTTLAALFVSVLVGILTAVLSVGYGHYTMNLWRGRPTDLQDLFRGLSLAGKVVPLALLIGLFSGLWSVACMAVYIPFAAVGVLLESEEALYVLLLLGTLVYLVLLINRLLRYSLAYYLLLDHPDWSAMNCLNASKQLMRGRLGSLFLLQLSFAGWYLLHVAIWTVVGVAVFGVAVLLLASLGHGYGAAAVGAAMFVMLLAFAAYLVLGSLCTLPLTLWLTPYISASTVGFYDCAAGCGYPQPARPPAPEPPAHTQYQSRDVAPRTPDAPGTLPPPRIPEPPAPHYYSGFGRLEDPPGPEDGAPRE